MNTEECQALQDSILHWEKNLAQTLFMEVDCSPKGCAVCVLNGYHCNTCIIYKATGQLCCRGTPYESIAQIMTFHYFDSATPLPPAYYDACRAEIAFLKSLIPKEKGKYARPKRL